MKNWFTIKNKADKAEIWIYEEIGEDFWTGGGITAKSFQKELANIKAGQIDLHINSPGGEVFSGITIYNLLKQHPANVTTYIDGLAASIASVIALAGNEVIMAENALMMIHSPWGATVGDSGDMRKMAESLDMVCDSICMAYMDKTKKKKEEIMPMMDEETWMSAADAMEMGFIDGIAENMDMAACAKFVPIMAKAKFKNVPDSLKEVKPEPTVRDMEHALRDVGCSQKQAKDILAKGYKKEKEDEVHQDDVLSQLGVVDSSTPIISDPPVVQQDVEKPPKKKDRIADLLVRAEMLAPST